MRILQQLFLFMCLLLLPAQGWGAIAVDQRTQGTPTATSPMTTAFTNNAVSPLSVCVVWQGTATISSVTWNGTSMGAALATKTDGANTAKVAAYVLKDAAAATANVVVTWSANPDVATTFIVGTTGGDTTTGYRTVYSRVDADGAGPGVTVVDSVNGDLVVHCAQVFEPTITFDGGEDTTGTEDDAIGGGGTSAGLSTKAATGANTVVGATDDTVYSEIAFALIPASAGSATVRNLMMMGVGQ